MSLVQSKEMENRIEVVHPNGKDHHKAKTDVSVNGKFFFVNGVKFYVKGVTYGAFKPDGEGREYPDQGQIDRDFKQMVECGFNTVRIPHTTPPRYVLDIAHRYGLKVMVGLSAEQYVGYIVDKKKMSDVFAIVKEKLAQCIGHPALLCVALGNEVPADIVRWIGRKKIEKYLETIYAIVKKTDSSVIVTYVNYPTTEYIQLPFLDVISFNVYLENKASLEAYVTRLHSIAGDRPLLLSEVGLDALRNGEEQQAIMLDWQIRTIFKSGGAGLFVFSWTDEWFRGGEEVMDWAFGITRKDRSPKPALAVVTKAFGETPFDNNLDGKPFITVVVCTHNGQKTIRKCLEGLSKIEYNKYEVLIIDDGSTDTVMETVNQFPFRSISTKPIGLSRARNLGMEKAKGDIVAYIDDDAYPDPHWLSYLAEAFASTDYAAIGGPNLLPQRSNLLCECVNNTPGTATHVLITDIEAEHIPGCNMAFRKEYLASIDGFDAQFRTAGDDVDICWRIQQAGWKIGFCAAAVVWHERRGSFRGFLKQQFGYGKAEALLEKKWPAKYNGFGHRTWGGVIYNTGRISTFIPGKWRIYYGVWGSAPFQSIYEPGNGKLLSFTMMPEWYVLSVGMTILSLLGILLKPLLFLVPFTILVVLLPVIHIVNSVFRFRPSDEPNRSWWYIFKFKMTSGLLHVSQPMARLLGRMTYNLTPWRRFSKARIGPFYRTEISIWCENWILPSKRLEWLEYNLHKKIPHIKRGGIFDRWDLWLKGGAFGGTRILMAAEDHAQRKQYLRFRLVPYIPSLSRYILGLIGLFFAIAIFLQEFYTAGILGVLLVLFLIRILSDCAIASGYSIDVMSEQANLNLDSE